MVEEVPGNQDPKVHTKQALWEKQIYLLKGIEDNDLPIDTEELIETIAALNLNGIHTVASNAGHAIETRGTGDTAYPWILISSDRDQAHTVLLHTELKSLLAEFYTDRNVPDDIKLRVDEKPEDDFVLSSVEENLMWREANLELSEMEKNALVEKLPERQEEMYAFGQFLKSKFLTSSD